MTAAKYTLEPAELDLPNRHYLAGYNQGLADQALELGAYSKRMDALLCRCIDVLQLPLAYMDGPFDAPKAEHWERVTGGEEVSPTVMCRVLQQLLWDLLRERR